MRIALGSDHGGVQLKAAIVEHLTARGFDVDDVGVAPGEAADYPDIAHVVAERVLAGEAARGVLICGTGQGMAMAANAHPGLRAAVVADTFSARMATEHNDAKVLCMGERVIGVGLALACVDAWLDAEFEGGRHARRVAKIEPRRQER